YRTLVPLPSPLQEHTVVALPPSIYLLGGIDGPSIKSAVHRYSTPTNTWSLAPPLPIPLHHPNAIVTNSSIYLFGGILDLFRWAASASSWKYTPSDPSPSWQKLADFPNPRGSCVVGVHNGKIWAVGGLGPAQLGGGRAASTMVSSYDIAEDTWTTHAELALPEGRDHAGGGVVGDTLYVVGGRVGTIASVRDTVYALDLGGLPGARWVEKRKMGVARGGIAAAVVEGKIFAFGGEGNVESEKGVFGEVEVYDTVGDTWVEGEAMRVPRHGFGAAVIGESVYLPGGGGTENG
ncbi:galactose oxidase, partial [Eremomyces bilateralis CBS 781.70]